MIAWLLASAAAQAPALDVAALQDRHLDVQRAGMGVLATWGVANIAAGGIGWATTEPGRRRAFWQGNAAWNVVNLGIAGASLATLPRRRRAPATLDSVRRQTRSFETALLVNAGLDVAYVATGLILGHVGRQQDRPVLHGFGDALVLQGGFLLGFDLTLFAVSRRASRPLRRG